MTVRCEVDGPVAVVTIDRPEVRNAVDVATARALVAAFDLLAVDATVSVVVLTGAKGMFCAGADLNAVASGDPVVQREYADLDAAHAPLGPTRSWFPKPVVAAVEGHAVAGGLELALWCDLRVAARDAVFGVYCRRWGVPLMDGGTVRLPRLVGHSRAMDMILTGRGVSGDEAVAFGLANRLVDPGTALYEAIQLARELSALPQACLRSDRASAYAQWGLDLTSALKVEARHGREVLVTGETAAGAAQFAGGAGRHGMPHSWQLPSATRR
jgi:enoyl-CoA hydratase